MEAYLKEKNHLIDKQLEALFPEKDTPYKKLTDAARYSLAGGKRLRPILALATIEALGGDEKKFLSAVCTLEMIHTYSLIHDDLPCMDDDDFRRGKLTLHKMYPEGHAVLAGDFLLTSAFETLAYDPNLTAVQKVELIKILSQSAGGDGMIGGQIMDIESEGKKIDFKALKMIHRYKTGKMITASILFGGILTKCSKPNRKILNQFGEEIGLAFQIVDDILDVTSSQQKHGRTIASDLINHKATYVTLLGLESAQQEADGLLKSALALLKKLPFDVSYLAKLAEFIVKRKT